MSGRKNVIALPQKYLRDTSHLIPSDVLGIILSRFCSGHFKRIDLIGEKTDILGNGTPSHPGTLTSFHLIRVVFTYLSNAFEFCSCKSCINKLLIEYEKSYILQSSV